MSIRKTLLSGILASSMALGGAMAFAQDSTPVADDVDATPVAADVTNLDNIPLVDVEGNVVANVSVWEDEDDGGVWFNIWSEDGLGLQEGKRGVHVHETGVCDSGDAFESAGGHFNPTNEAHGDINADPSHAGDLGNLEVDDEGNFEHEVLAEKLTMTSGEPNSLNDEDGAVLIIHSGEDDLETDPSGESGDRWACGVIFASPEEQGTPEATPMADESSDAAAGDANSASEDEVTPEEVNASDESNDVVVTEDEDADDGN